MSKIYRIEFEVVSSIGKGGHYYGGPLGGRTPTEKPSEVPDEFWQKITTDATDSPWQQYNQLKAWAETGEQLIRNVKLFEGEVETQWKEMFQNKTEGL